jgi:arsenate reductase
MITLYGIPNCNTVSKARAWLSDHNIDYHFHNFKKDGLNKDTLNEWIAQLGWEVLLNKRGMTWRKLSDEQKQAIDHDKATAIMLEHTSIIKRPVLNVDGQLFVGFKNEQYESIF